MFFKYRDRLTLDKKLKDDYDNSYSLVGRTHLLSMFVVIVALLAGSLVIAVIYGLKKKHFS